MAKCSQLTLLSFKGLIWRVRQGFHTPLSYILTQLPLPYTVEDFWRMVVEERCNTVVLLDAVDTDTVSDLHFTVTAFSDEFCVSPSHLSVKMYNSVLQTEVMFNETKSL